MNTIVWTDCGLDYGPDYGPPKPRFCIDGPSLHRWELSIEEGEVTLGTDCRLCTDGLFAQFTSEEFEMHDTLYVSLAIHIENEGSDMAYPWVEITEIEVPQS